MTIVYNYDFYMTKTEQLFCGRIASKVTVCLVRNAKCNHNRPLRRYQIAEITGLNAHNISATLEQMVKLGILIKHAIDGNVNKTGFYLNIEDDAVKAMIDFITVFESPKVAAMLGRY